MKVQQRITRTEITEINVEFPAYTEHDVGDDNRYVVTTRYELQHRAVPTFLVTTITETNDGFEIDHGQAISIDKDLKSYQVSVAEWGKAIDRFTKWYERRLLQLKTELPPERA